MTVVVFVPDGVFPPLVRLGRSLLHRRRPPRLSRVLTSAPRAAPELRPRGEPVAVVSELEFSYGALEVLRGVDFEIKAGELLCIVGPNGAGKSTLLNVLTDGKLPARGSIEYHLHAGELSRQGKADPPARACGHRPEVPDPAPLRQPDGRRDDPARVAEGPDPLALQADEGDPGRADRCSTSSGRPALEGREDVPSPALAHGLKQGLELAAAVSVRPELLLLDEPTAGLTSNERHVIGDVFRRLVEAGMTIVLIEHDLDFVARVADRVIVLHGGKRGRVRDARRGLGLGSRAGGVRRDGRDMKVEVSGLRSGYGSATILEGIDFVVPEHGALAVVGRNGMGKSTLLKTVMGYIKPSQGKGGRSEQGHHRLADLPGHAPRCRLRRAGEVALRRALGRREPERRQGAPLPAARSARR